MNIRCSPAVVAHHHSLGARGRAVKLSSASPPLACCQRSTRGQARLRHSGRWTRRTTRAARTPRPTRPRRVSISMPGLRTCLQLCARSRRRGKRGGPRAPWLSIPLPLLVGLAVFALRLERAVAEDEVLAEGVVQGEGLEGRFAAESGDTPATVAGGARGLVSVRLAGSLTKGWNRYLAAVTSLDDRSPNEATVGVQLFQRYLAGWRHGLGRIGLEGLQILEDSRIVDDCSGAAQPARWWWRLRGVGPLTAAGGQQRAGNAAEAPGSSPPHSTPPKMSSPLAACFCQRAAPPASFTSGAMAWSRLGLASSSCQGWISTRLASSR